jgi:hypothetical protein
MRIEVAVTDRRHRRHRPPNAVPRRDFLSLGVGEGRSSREDGDKREESAVGEAVETEKAASGRSASGPRSRALVERRGSRPFLRTISVTVASRFSTPRDSPGRGSGSSSDTLTSIRPRRRTRTSSWTKRSSITRASSPEPPPTLVTTRTNMKRLTGGVVGGGGLRAGGTRRWPHRSKLLLPRRVV